MTEDVKATVNSSITDDDKGRETVPKSRLDEVIGERNVLRGEKEGWTEKEKEFLGEIAELDDYKKLKELANSDPRIAQAIMKALNETLGDEAKTKTIPARIRETGKPERDKKFEALQQKVDDMAIEKLFDKIGVKDFETDKLSEFCTKNRINMLNETLLEMAYTKVFPEKEEKADRGKEPDSSSVSGMDYGSKEIKTVKDAIAFAIEQSKKKKK